MASTPRATLDLERDLWSSGRSRVAGLDEAGRGAWAGPVVAAAVILPPDIERCRPLVGQVHDSKQLTARAREGLVNLVHAVAVSIGVGLASPAEIDQIGIVPATRQAMLRALAQLDPAPDFLLVDALSLPETSVPQRAVIRGDAISLSIAAASIIAKVTRDRLLVSLDARYPGYGFARNKGYGTPEHRRALLSLGPCDVHRMSFRPLLGLQKPLWGDVG